MAEIAQYFANTCPGPNEENKNGTTVPGLFIITRCLATCHVLIECIESQSQIIHCTYDTRIQPGLLA